MLKHRYFIIGLLVMLAACSSTHQVAPVGQNQAVVQLDCANDGYAGSGYDDPVYAPEFSLVGLDGQRYMLERLRGCWVMVNFWATWCAPCVEEMPVLQDVSEIFRGELILLGINQREKVATVRPFVRDLAITFPILVNPPDSLLSQYGVVNLPQTVLVDPNGEIVWRQFGPIDLDNFSELLRHLILGDSAP